MLSSKPLYQLKILKMKNKKTWWNDIERYPIMPQQDITKKDLIIGIIKFFILGFIISELIIYYFKS